MSRTSFGLPVVGLAACVLLATACGKDSPASPSPSCTFTVSDSPSVALAAAGHEFTVTVSAGAGCNWTASSSAAFVTLIGATSGSGNGSVKFAVAVNSGVARQGSVTVAGRSLVVTQDGAPQGCEYSVSTEAVNIAKEGGDVTIDVTASAAGCAWTAASTSAFVTIKEGAAGTGNGRVVLAVAANAGDARAGSTTVAGRTVTILQESFTPPAVPCEFTVSPSLLQAPGGGLGNALITVTKTQGGTCPWVTQVTVPWITVTGPPQQQGSGTFTITVAGNPGGQRAGSVLLTGNPNGPRVDVSQAAGATPGCAFSVAPLQVSAPETSSSIAVTITQTQGLGCQWTAVPQVNFLTIPGTSFGTGSGSVTINVGNNLGAQRSGTVIIAGQTLTVTQAGPAVLGAVVLSIQSDVGDYVGQGQTKTYVLRGSEASIDVTFQGVQISMPFQALGHWMLRMTDGAFQRPAPGLYELAERSGFQSPGLPGLDFSMDSRGCNQVLGRFLVQEAVYGAGNTLQRFHARFQNHCEGVSRALRGEIWVDALGSTTPPALQAFPSSGPPSSLFSFTSAPGDPVGHGTSPSYTLSTARFSAKETPNRPGVQIIVDEPVLNGQRFQLFLAAASGSHLTPGTYENAGSFISTPPGVPGMTLFANSAGCATVAGRFVVLEASYGPKAEVYRFHATFEISCNGFGTPLRGEVRIVADPWR